MWKVGEEERELSDSFSFSGLSEAAAVVVVISVSRL